MDGRFEISGGRMTVKYVIHPGEVESKADGQHWAAKEE
jgi:hypothetical protein